MYLRCLIGLLCTLALSACSPFGEIQNSTKAINATDLSVHHVYKLARKVHSPSKLKKLNDKQLTKLIGLALVKSPNIGIAKARLQRGQAIAKGAYTTLWPSIVLGGSLKKQYIPLHGKVPEPFDRLQFDTLNSGGLALNFNYEIDFWGKNREILASRLSERYAAEMDLAQSRLVLSATVATAYFGLQNNLMQLRLATENRFLEKQRSDIFVDRAKRGVASDISVKTALAKSQAALLSVEENKAAEIQSRHQLAVLLGKNPLTTQIDTAAFKYHKKALVLPKIIPANILAQRPDIAAARALTEAAAHQVKVAKSAFFPNINLKGLLSSQHLYFNKSFNVALQNDSITGAIDLPIFDAGARRANLHVKYAEYELAVNQYNQTILNALREVGDEIAALKTLNTQVEAQNQALKTTEANYLLVQSQYTQGLIDYLNLIAIKQSLLEQKAMLYNLQTRQMQAYVALLAALGNEV